MIFRRPALAAMLLVFSAATASADIILQVSDDGTDLTLQWTGTMDVGGSGTVFNLDLDWFNADSSIVASLDGTGRRGGAGTVSGNDPWLLDTVNSNPGNGTGLGFGFSGGSLFWDDSFGFTPGVIAPDRTWTFTGLTVADAFGTNLDGGPVLLWTNDNTGDTISVAHSAAAIPEPGSFALLAFAGVGLAVRRRKRARGRN